jgi:hypothetical protein
LASVVRDLYVTAACKSGLDTNAHGNTLNFNTWPLNILASR